MISETQFENELQLIIKNGIREDVGDGDHSSLACIPADAIGQAKLLVKEDGIIAGVAFAEMILNYVDSDLKIGAFNFINYWSKKLVSKGFFYGFNHRGLSQMSHQENYSLFQDSFKIGEDRESNQLLKNNTFQHEFLFTPTEKTIIKHLSFVNVSSSQNNFQSTISNKELFFVKESLQSPTNAIGQMLQ